MRPQKQACRPYFILIYWQLDGILGSYIKEDGNMRRVPCRRQSDRKTDYVYHSIPAKISAFSYILYFAIAQNIFLRCPSTFSYNQLNT